MSTLPAWAARSATCRKVRRAFVFAALQACDAPVQMSFFAIPKSSGEAERQTHISRELQRISDSVMLLAAHRGAQIHLEAYKLIWYYTEYLN